MKLFDDQFFTHMPFVFEGQLLHCKGITRDYPAAVGHQKVITATSQFEAYDLYCSDLDGTNSFHIGADLGDDAIACSPNAYRDLDGNVILSYVAASPSLGDRRYRHFQKKGRSLHTLSTYTLVAEPLGFQNRCQTENQKYSYTVVSTRASSRLIQYDKAEGVHRMWRFDNIADLKRAVVFEENSVVLTYVIKSRATKSALLDTCSGLLMDIRVHGADIYKSHLHGSTVYYAVRTSADKYGMSIHRDTYTLQQSRVVARASDWMPTRPHLPVHTRQIPTAAEIPCVGDVTPIADPKILTDRGVSVKVE